MLYYGLAYNRRVTYEMLLSYPNVFIGYQYFKNRTKSEFPLKTTAGMTGVTRTLTIIREEKGDLP
jgi:hypothetical protein